MNLTDKQIGYIAGIIDGEGTICITRTLIVKSNCYNYLLLVQVTNTNLELLKYLQKITELGKIIEKGRKLEKHKIAYVWDLRVKDIKVLLPLIKDVLVVKKNQAALMLEFIETIPFKRNNSQNPLTLDQRIEKELIYEELKVLNKRGI